MKRSKQKFSVFKVAGFVVAFSFLLPVFVHASFISDLKDTSQSAWSSTLSSFNKGLYRVDQTASVFSFLKNLFGSEPSVSTTTLPSIPSRSYSDTPSPVSVPAPSSTPRPSPAPIPTYLNVSAPEPIYQYITKGITHAELAAQLNALELRLKQRTVSLPYSHSGDYISHNAFDNQVDRIYDSIENSSKNLNETLTAQINAIDITSPATLSVSGEASFGSYLSLADVSAPADTTNKLYNSSGDLYWQGNLLSGATVGNWSSSGTDVWRVSGNVGVGTTSPYSAFSVVSNSLARPLAYISGNIGGPAGDFYNDTALLLENKGTNGQSGSVALGFKTKDSSGQFGIFTNNASSTRLYFWDNVASNFPFIIGNNSTDFTTRIFTISGTLAVASTTGTSTFSGAATFAKNVGIGTSTPWKKLSVSGDMVLTGGLFDSLASAGTNGMVLQSTGSATKWVATSTLGLTSTLTGTTGQIAYFSGSNTAVGTSSLFISPSGNIGIGTSNPLQLLDLGNAYINTNGSASFSNGAISIGGSSGSVAYINSSGELRVQPAGIPFVVGYISNVDAIGLSYGYSNEFMVDINGNVAAQSISGSGFNLANSSITIGDTFGTAAYISQTGAAYFADNVGIGTISPLSKLHISGGGTQNGDITMTFGSDGSYRNIIDNTWSAGVAASNLMVFKVSDGSTTGSTNVMTLTGAGNVGIGTSSPYAKLSVAGTIVGQNFVATSTTATSTFAGLISGTNGLWFEGTTGSTPISGAGTRLMWIPSKGAFRAGAVCSGACGANQWDDANIGTNSVAFGNASKASGSGSFAGGWSVGVSATGMTASQLGSFAYGYTTGGIASPASVNATGLGSVAMGMVAGASGGRSITSSGNGSIAMGYATGANLTATGNGAVAIGQDVNATANNAFALGSSFTNSTASTFQIGFSSTPTLTVTTSNIGIGSTSPTYPLTITGTGYNTGYGVNQLSITSASSEVGFNLNNTGTSGRNYSLYSTNNLSGVGAGKFILADVGANATRLSIDSSGNVGVGITDPITKFSNTNTNLTDFGGSRSVGTGGIIWTVSESAKYAVGIYNSNTTTDSGGLLINVPATSNSYRPISINRGTTELFTVDKDGAVFKPGGGSFSATSDERSKKNIHDFNVGLDAIIALQPVTYEYNGRFGTPTNNKTYVGVLAQQALATSLGAYGVTSDLYNGEQFYRWDSTAMAYATVNAIKELNLKIESLIASTTLPHSVGVTSFFKNIFVDKVTTPELCIGDETDSICITKEQLKDLLKNNTTHGSTGNSGSNTTPPVGDPEPTPEPIGTSTPPVSEDTTSSKDEPEEENSTQEELEQNSSEENNSETQSESIQLEVSE